MTPSTLPSPTPLRRLLRRIGIVSGSAAVIAASLVAMPQAAYAETVSVVLTDFAVSGDTYFYTAGSPNPVSMVGTPNGEFLYANDYEGNRVLRAATTTPPSSIAFTGIGTPAGLAMHPSNTYVLIAHYDTGKFTKLPVSTTTVPGTYDTYSLTTGAKPLAVAIHPTNNTAYFASRGTSNLLLKVDLSTNSVVGTYSFGTVVPSAMTLSPDGSVAWVASKNAGSVARIDTSSMTEVSPGISIPSPLSLAISPDGRHVVVTSALQATTTYTISVATLAVTASNHGGNKRPLAVSIDPSSQFAYIGKYGFDNVKLDLPNQNTSAFSASGANEVAGIFFPSTGTEAHRYAYAAQTSSGPLVRIAISPSAPTPVDGTRGDRQVALTWTAPVYPGAGTVTDYTVQYSTDNTSWSTIAHTASTATAITVTDLDNGTPYYFRVAGVSSAGTGLFGYVSGTRTPAGVPGPPTAITATPGSGQLAVNWIAPASDGGVPLTDYVIEYSTNNTTWSTFAHTPSTATSATITGLTNGIAYYVRVAAVNSIGTSAFGAGGPWAPSATSGGGGGTPDPGPGPGTPTNPAPPTTPGVTSSASLTGATGATAPTSITPNIASARVIYRMKPTGSWEVVPRFRAAAKRIPQAALFTVVRSPITGQSKNIPAAQVRSRVLAASHIGTAHPNVLKGKLWRGRARIIVNW